MATKLKARTLKIERLARFNGRVKDGAVIEIPLTLSETNFKALKKAFAGGMSLYICKVL